MNRLLIRIVLPLLIIAAGWRVFEQFRAARMARQQPTLEGLQEAIRLDPEGSDYHFRLGVAHRDVPELRDTDRARSHLEKAVALNPYNWRYQRELAQLYELSDQIQEAEDAFVRAVSLNPGSSSYRWRLANFYLRNRSIDQAVPQLELALAANHRLSKPVLGLLLRTGASYPQIERAWPGDPESLRRLLPLLCRPPSGEAGSKEGGTIQDFRRRLWDRLLAGAEPLPLADGQVYVERLIEERRFEEARARWIELAGSNGWSDAGFEQRHNLIWNGDFERPLTQTGLGWQVRDAGGYSAARLEGEGSDGSHALRIAFDGSQNVSSLTIQQRVIVEPGRSYRLSFDVRTQDLSTDQGVFLAVQDGPSHRRLAATEGFRGSLPWTVHTAGFVAEGPWVLVLLGRDSSLRFDNQIGGVLWIDSVSLESATS